MVEPSVARQEEIGGAQVDPDALIETIRQLAAELHPTRSALPSTLDHRLERDYGFDSLGRVELFLRIERRFGVSLPENVMAGAETPRDVLRAILAAGPAQRSSAAAAERVTSLEAESATPDAATTFAEVLAWHVARHPDRP